jgi:hypothetical protein
MLNQFLFSELHYHYFDLATVWLQQNGVREQAAQQSMNTSRTASVYQIISYYSNISWTAHLPNLFACESFLWSHLKSEVFQTHLADLNTLKQRISEEFNATSPAMLLHLIE